MATQYLTVAKIAGEAAEKALKQFREWSELRVCADANEWEPSQWPEAVRRAAERWANGLRSHGDVPPVLFYLEYVDSWSFCPPHRFLKEHGISRVFSDSYELFCMPVPLSTPAVTDLESIKSNGQWDEDRLFASLTLTAAESWTGLVAKGVLIFLRRVVRGSTTDEEILASLDESPAWMDESN